MKNLTSILAVAAMTVLTACSNENESVTSADGRTELNITAGINFALHNITGTITPWTPGWNEGGTGV